MKEKVLALAKGNFAYETPALILNPEKLEITVTAGGKQTERIQIRNTAGTKVKGFGAVEEPDIEFLPVFDAINNELVLTIDASRWSAGEQLRGMLQFVTDCGEAGLPYEITVTAPQLKDEKGTVSDYYMLQERMKEDPEEGAKLFHSEQFRDVFLYRDQAGKLLYDHLTAKDTKLQSMEEFLIAMGKKPVLHFDVTHVGSGSSREITYELNGTDISDSVKIRINTWGSTGIRVSSTAEFIRPEMHMVWADEFEKDTDILEYTILADKVKKGTRYGSLVFESPYERREIHICVHNQEGARERKVARAKKAVFDTLYRMYLAYREERVTREEFQNLIWNNRRVIRKLEHKYQTAVKGLIPAILRDERDMVAFYQQTEDTELPKPGSPLTEVENYILIQFIKFLYSKRRDDRENISHLLEIYGKKGYDSLLLFYIKLHTDICYEEQQKKVQDIREHIQNGMNSPLLYSELLQLYRQDPTLISELDFVTVATINYGLKYDLINDDMAVVISFLSERSAVWKPTIFHMMTRIYDRFGSDDMLRAICSLLIRNEVRGHRYFKWFERGIKAHLRITDLYEYYMYTMDRAATFSLPESVLTYFQYENHLNMACKAFLYAYIVKKRDSLPEYYDHYKEIIREFALTQLSHHKISEDMATIYEAVFEPEDIVDSVATELPKVMFTENLTCYHSGMEGVLVVHVETREEVYYPIVAGNARIQIYTPNYQLYFVDAQGRYYCGSIEYRLQKLLHMEHYAGLCYENGARYTPLMIWLAVAAERGVNISESQAQLLYEVCRADVLRDYTKSRFLLCLYDYYKKENDTTGVLMVLDEWQPEQMKKERRGEIASDCIYHGMYDKAEQIFLEYGIRGSEKKALSMLLLEKIRKNEEAFVPVYVKWALYLYREHYYEWGVLNYLLKYYMGETKTLTAIFHRCVELAQGASVEDGSRERLLGQVLFTGTSPADYEELFLNYYEKGNNRILVKAFLSEFAYEYVVDRIEISESVFVKIEKEALYEKEKIMVLAALKYYSKMREFAKKQKDFIELQLENCVGEGLVLSFMKDFIGKVEVPNEIEDSVLVQHYSGTTKGVFLFLRKDREQQYEAYPMRQVFDGIYTKELLLFADEEKQGYIYEEEDDRRFDEIILRPSGWKKGAPGFYRMINEMIEAGKDLDDARYRKIRREYLERHQVADRLFVIH